VKINIKATECRGLVVSPSTSNGADEAPAIPRCSGGGGEEGGENRT